MSWLSQKCEQQVRGKDDKFRKKSGERGAVLPKEKCRVISHTEQPLRCRFGEYRY